MDRPLRPWHLVASAVVCQGMAALGLYLVLYSGEFLPAVRAALIHAVVGALGMSGAAFLNERRWRLQGGRLGIVRVGAGTLPALPFFLLAPAAPSSIFFGLLAAAAGLAGGLIHLVTVPNPVLASVRWSRAPRDAGAGDTSLPQHDGAGPIPWDRPGAVVRCGASCAVVRLPTSRPP